MCNVVLRNFIVQKCPKKKQRDDGRGVVKKYLLAIERRPGELNTPSISCPLVRVSLVDRVEGYRIIAGGTCVLARSGVVSVVCAFRQWMGGKEVKKKIHMRKYAQ